MSKSKFLELIEVNTKDSIVFIKNETIDNTDMDFYDKTIEKYIFIKCTFTKDFTFLYKGVIETEFRFEQCIFKEQVEFDTPNSEYKANLVFNSTTHKYLLRFNGTYREQIFIRDIRFEDSLLIDFTSPVDRTTKYKSIIIRDCNKTIKDIKFSGIEVEELYILNMNERITSIESLSIINSILNKVTISQVKLNEFILDNIDFVENSKVLFEKIETNNFEIQKISQDVKYMQFHHIKVIDEFICKRVELKNTYFNDFDISQANKKFDKTSFIDAHLNSINWGDFCSINSSRDTFRQLKFVNDKQGNHIEANNFYMMEMKKYKESIANTKSPDRAIFFFNDTVSNFGQSWTRPLCIYICLGLIFSILMFYCFPNRDMTFEKILVDTYNPISKSIVEKYSFVGLVYKIFSGLIIYQLVMALKRQTKR